MLTLSKAFALTCTTDEARRIRDEIGFFQTVRAVLAKSASCAGKSSAERDLALQQIVSRAVVSTEIVDILNAAGLDTPDISILSDEFLAEIQGVEKKNLAMEVLRKLINGELHLRSRVNVVQTRAFSQRLEKAIARYHGNAITQRRSFRNSSGSPRTSAPPTDAARKKDSARRRSPSTTPWPRTRAQSRRWATTTFAWLSTSC